MELSGGPPVPYHAVSRDVPMTSDPRYSAANAETLSRRRFVQGLALGGLAVSAGWPLRSMAAPERHTITGHANVLTGPNFDLSIGETIANFTGKNRRAVTVNGHLPAPILRVREGEEFVAQVHNTLDEITSIHWHGLPVPANMDGVPGLSFHGIAPKETFTYRFKLKQHGTYWFHGHSGSQEQLGLYGALIVDPSETDGINADREHVILLSDWSDVSPQRLLARLKKQSHYYNHRRRTVSDFLHDARNDGFSATLEDRKAWGRMRMSPSDLSDVNGYAYTYLVNGVPPAGNWTGLFTPGETLRLRIINGSAMSIFDLRIPGLELTIVAADGQRVKPVTVDELRIGTAETYDILVTPKDDRAYTLFAQSNDRSGYACATLAPRAGMSAEVPKLDEPVYLTMDDMGHGGMSHGAMDHSTMDHSMHAGMNHGDGAMQTHPTSESNNPLVDMQTMMPTARLDDPGIGLRNNGRRVLSYSMLHSDFPDPDGRTPERTIELHLTGHMERYAWGFDGIKFSSAEPLKLTYGERVRIVLVNDTMMEHPIHLHGLWSDLEDEHGRFLVRKHTVLIPPGTKRSFRVRVDALGRWAFHCHLLFHMDLGMFREVRVEESA